MKKLNKQILSALLALLMFLNSCPVSAFAADLDETVPETTQTIEATQPEVTDPPVTEPPVTAPPTTEPPTTEPPTTEPPASDPAATDPVGCQTCGKADCTVEHTNWCAICEADECGKDHSKWCDICKKDECGLTHVFCEICKKHDCGVAHVYCETCEAYDCGVEHVYCKVCKVNDCGKTHVFCKTCDQYDCGKKHVFCDICNMYDCIVDGHGEPAAAQSAASTEPTAPSEPAATVPAATEPTATEPVVTEPVDNCPYCDDTTAEDGAVVHASNCNTNFPYNGAEDVGKYATLTSDAKAYGLAVSGNPKADPDGMQFYAEDFEGDVVLHITGWYWDISTSALWYRVGFYSGSVIDEAKADWPAPAWILNSYTNPDNSYGVSLSLFEGCSVCDLPDCEMTHVLCKTCNAYDCTEIHVDVLTGTPKDLILAAANTDPLMGKLVKFKSDYPYVWSDPANVNSQTPVTAANFPAQMRVVDTHSFSESTTLYKLESADGSAWPAEHADYVWAEAKYLEIIEENTCSCCETCTGDESCQCGCGACAFCEPAVPELKDETTGVTVLAESFPAGVSLSVHDADVSAQLSQFGVPAEKQVFGLDISLILENADYQPDGSVLVKVPVDAAPGTQICILHTHNGNTTSMGLTKVLPDKTVEFTTSGFSTFAGFTVDFHYNGIDYSIPGLTSITLSELFQILEIDRQASRVIDVTYSDPSQIKVTQLDGDWQLESLKAFDTTEKLEITFADGEIITIVVTDAKNVKRDLWIIDNTVQGSITYNTPAIGNNGHKVTFVLLGDGVPNDRMSTDVTNFATAESNSGFTLHFPDKSPYWYTVSADGFNPSLDDTKKMVNLTKKKNGTVTVTRRNRVIKMIPSTIEIDQQRYVTLGATEKRTVKVIVNDNVNDLLVHEIDIVFPNLGSDIAKKQLDVFHINTSEFFYYKLNDKGEKVEHPTTEIRNNELKYIDTNGTTYTYEGTTYTIRLLTRYNVLFNANGGTGSMENQPFIWGENISLTKNTFTHPGFTVTFDHNYASKKTSDTAAVGFVNWKNESTGVTYADESSVANKITEKPNGAVTLKAQWEAKESVTLPTLTRAGYTFGGWYSDSTLVNKVGDGGTTYTPTSSTTLYAKWTANDTGYKVQHWQQKIGAAATQNSTNYVLTKTENLEGKTDQSTSAAAETYTGFTAQSFSQTTIAGDGSTVVNIYYTRNKYDIIFENEDGTQLQSSQVAYGDTPAYTAALPSKSVNGTTTHRFKAWDKTIVAVTGAATYTATYDRTAYVVTYAANGGSGTMAQQVFDVGSSVTIAGNGFTNAGKTFIRWVTDQADTLGTGTTYEPGDTYGDDAAEQADVTLYALWGYTFNVSIVDEAGNPKGTISYDPNSHTAPNQEWGESKTTYWPGGALKNDQIIFTPAAGYAVTGVKITVGATTTTEAGSNVADFPYKYKFEDEGLTDNTTIVVTIKRVNDAKLTVSGTNGCFTIQQQSQAASDLDTGTYTYDIGSCKNAVVTFIPNNGYEIEKVTESVTGKSIVERTGFTGNYTYTIPAEGLPKGETKIDVTTRKKTFSLTVTIDDGGTIENTIPETVEYQTEVEIQYKPKPGYKIDSITVNGTSLGTDLKPAGGTLKHKVYSDTTIVITTVRNVFNLTFDSNGGSTVETMKVVYGDKATIPADPTRANARFLGWCCDEDGNGEINGTEGDTLYKAGDQFTMPERDVTMIAQWVDDRMLAPHQIYVGINMSFYENNGGWYYDYPNEPAMVHGLKAVRLYINDNGAWMVQKFAAYNSVTDINDYFTKNLPGDPRDYIEDSFWDSDRLKENTGDGTIGIVDTENGLREDLKFSEHDYTGMIAAWLEACRDAEFRERQNNVFGSINVNWDAISTESSDYVITPYVIKLQDNGHWYVDMVIQPKVRHGVEYRLNLDSAYTPTQDPVDENQYGTGFEVKMKSMSDVAQLDDPAIKAKFLGWCYDANNNDIIDADEGNTVYRGNELFTMPAFTTSSKVTMIAKWDYPVSLTISNTAYGERQGDTFLFRVQGTKPDNSTVKNVDMIVSIRGTGSVTIKGLYDDFYTVTPLTEWSWTYKAENTAQTVELTTADRTVTFGNTFSKPWWLFAEGHN